MDNCNLFLFLQFLFLLFPLLLASSTKDRQVYIVYLGEHHGDKTHQEIEENHHSYLFSVKETEEDAKSSLIYSYKNSINGFAAFLTQQEASDISEREEVVSVFQSHPGKYALHTTRSWEFSALQESTNSSNIDKNSLLYKSGYGKDIIIGMLDSGIWPESESFNDEGMDVVPKRWKGTCQAGHKFNSSNCNNAGNEGPTSATVVNPAPWTITVGASSIDRVFSSAVVLGSGAHIKGQSMSTYEMENKMHPLVFAGDVTMPDVPKNESGQCLPDSLSPDNVKGKIVLCWRGDGSRVGKGAEVKRAGGIGYILGNNKTYGNQLSADSHVLPATHVTYEDALRILEYIDTAKQPSALITPAKTVLGSTRAPVMADFSSRGPSIISPQILKPDITAPGFNILAAWSGASSPTGLPGDNRVVNYNIVSGTSMACPHVAGALALLKAVHPNWSSAALRSALMTSARLVDNEGKPITDASGSQAGPFDFGSGQFDPNRAIDPGLVYDAAYEDYLVFLCGIKKLPSPIDLNYPSLAIPKLKSTVTVTRTVTNVGPARSVYSSSIQPPPGTDVKIRPSELRFNQTGQKMSFTITVKRDGKFTGQVGKDNYTFGSYKWCDGVHVVRSPMAVSLAL
ncbi:subtilase family protein [Striga hermonthica]|uniref:Subtilase family protein n=1 Tax=Striga hermonthica TaxID=68872 RepID=A0A9N7N5R0_STRHE|nr:subtilase family protein [Striga hermonthica]